MIDNNTTVTIKGVEYKVIHGLIGLERLDEIGLTLADLFKIFSKISDELSKSQKESDGEIDASDILNVITDINMAQILTHALYYGMINGSDEYLEKFLFKQPLPFTKVDCYRYLESVGVLSEDAILMLTSFITSIAGAGNRDKKETEKKPKPNPK